MLRIHPVAMLMFPRRVESPVTLGGYAFNPGDVLLVGIQSLHEREDVYTEPLRFNSDRFLGRSYGSNEFLSFGGGSRRCIGAALAVYEMKLILAKLLQTGTYRLTPASDRNNLPRRRGFMLGPTHPVRLQLMSARR